jgi:hypothetical protein
MFGRAGEIDAAEAGCRGFRMSERQRRRLGAVGVFLALLGIYLLTAPGRIDIIDGQWRYEVTRNWLDAGEPVVTDPVLLGTGGQVVSPSSGKAYSVYNAAPSVAAMPLMLLSRLLPGHNLARDHALFSLTGPVYGAAIGALLIVAFGWLGLGMRRSLTCTAIVCLGTLWWPASVTVFDQNQHAVLLLATVLVGWQAARRRSPVLAGVAGMVGGLLVNYQEMYALLLPALGLAVFAAPETAPSAARPPEPGTARRDAALRYVLFGLGCCVGIGLFAAFNVLRYGAPVLLSRYGLQSGGGSADGPSTWGNPLAGFLSLAISPGKGIFWFSPPLVLMLLGARRLWARVPALTAAVVAASVIHLLVITRLAFFGGDWCWGPRYIIPILPLWALALPFALTRPGLPRCALAPLALAGLLIQVMGLSLDQHRFFYERNFVPSFWAADPWVYFKHSQLLARPGEILESLAAAPLPEPVRFSAAPTGQPTYCPFGPPIPAQSREWVRHQRLFYLPRCWWGWFGVLPSKQQPVNPFWLLGVCGVPLAVGGVMLSRSLRSLPPAADASTPPPREPAEEPIRLPAETQPLRNPV